MKTSNLQTKISTDYNFTSYSNNVNRLSVIKVYTDGVMIDLNGSPYNVEHHKADVQIWRNSEGKIVAIDIVYE